VVIIGQPAEEIGAGALAMIRDGLFERFPRPDYCLTLHVASDQPAGDVGYSSGWATANVDSVDITIHGRGGHGSRPSETIDPVVTAAQVIVALQSIVSRRVDPIDPAVITVGSVHAGSKHNIIPHQAKMQLTVRSYTDQTRRILLDGIREVTINTCRAMGCKQDPDVVIREDEFTPAGYNDPALAAAAAEVMRRAIGDEQVVILPARMGGEDFGQYARHLKVPGFMFWLGTVNRQVFEAAQAGGPPLPPLHSSTYVADPEPSIATGIKCVSSIALSLLESPD
jgi:hippurate hydrolase